tara:strand:+ start:672 stop:1226 length:555 start_codon:yes stop_codon:yes gene_type:complete
MLITIVSRVDHINRFFQYQCAYSDEECSQMLLQNTVIEHSNNICQELYCKNSTCSFCSNSHDGMLNCAKIVKQDEEENKIFIKNIPIVCCKHCVHKIPRQVQKLDNFNEYALIFSNWVRPTDICQKNMLLQPFINHNDVRQQISDNQDMFHSIQENCDHQEYMLRLIQDRYESMLCCMQGVVST